jgi:hypothetical protein
VSVLAAAHPKLAFRTLKNPRSTACQPLRPPQTLSPLNPASPKERDQQTAKHPSKSHSAPRPPRQRLRPPIASAPAGHIFALRRTLSAGALVDRALRFFNSNPLVLNYYGW